ncbi:MAG TPA: hypothetical protein VN643_25240 [Pyrinomonadaceae bacterium]|nr:hypothetical protein [Pyrinomonadaceae bacterium]
MSRQGAKPQRVHPLTFRRYLITIAYVLAAKNKKRVTKNYTENVEAYQLYLRGRFEAYHVTPASEEIVQAKRAQIRKTFELDPHFFIAYHVQLRAYEQKKTCGGPSNAFAHSASGLGTAQFVDERSPLRTVAHRTVAQAPKT